MHVSFLIFIALMVTLLPLSGALVAGLLGQRLGRRCTHRVVITLIGIACLLSIYLLKIIILDGHPAVEESVYTWATVDTLHFDVAFLLDRLSATMLFVVLFISLMVHIYTIGYMADDPGYQRFFSYVSLFTFAMLVLVLANNFLLLFFGWEAVGLVSYLLIGFWFKRESANRGSLKAFLVNRVGDVGLILGIAALFKYAGTLDYQPVFRHAAAWAEQSTTILPGLHVSVLTLICFLLFIGAMGKSAQVPLHVWLPESMEGPTPISALIHAATMVTAGIYMVARLSPLFEYTPAVLSLVLVIGATTALFMGWLAIVQNDIKRVIAYSTISQLGYMVAALGVSAYDAAIFHLITHAFFKALLFLAAGSVIIALHHEQDMRQMGGLAKRLPVTYLTFVIGALALSAIPPFSGFYSKEIIIESVKVSTIAGADYAYLCVLIGAFFTPLYIFRALFLTFHTHLRTDQKQPIQESAWVMLAPLIGLAIPSIIAGGLLIDRILFMQPGLLGESIFTLPSHRVLSVLATHYPGAKQMALEAVRTLSFWLALAGIFTAWLFTVRFPSWAQVLKRRFAWVYHFLLRKYGFDDFNQVVFVQGAQQAGHLCYDISDVKLIDGIVVNGSGRLTRWFSQIGRHLQTGYLYHYALAMVVGIVVCLLIVMGERV